MVQQSYQQVSLVVLEELVKNPNAVRVENWGKMEDKSHKRLSRLHEHFYKLKKGTPEKYERLFYDANGHIPFSEDLDAIFMDFKRSGIMDRDYNVNLKEAKKYLNKKEN
jgi:hypothetical protein